MTAEANKLRGQQNAKGMRIISPKIANKTSRKSIPKNTQYEFKEDPNAKDRSERSNPKPIMSGDNNISTGANNRAIHDTKGKNINIAKT